MTKSKIIKIVAIALAAVILIGAGVCLLVPSIRNSFTKPDKLYEKAEGKWLTSKTETISNVFSKVSNVASGKKEVGYNTSLKLVMSDAFAQEANLSGIKDIGFTANASAKDGYTLTTVAFEGNGKKAVTANVITDDKNGNAYFQVPELNKAYIQMSSEEASKLIEQMSGSNSTVNSTLNKVDIDSLKNDFLAELGITDKEFEDTLNRYTEVFIKGTKDVKKGSDKGTIDGKKYDYTTLTKSLTYNDLMNLGSDVLKEMKDDDVITKIVTKGNNISEEAWKAQLDGLIAQLDGGSGKVPDIKDKDYDDDDEDEDEDDGKDDENLFPKKTDMDDEVFKIVTYIDKSTQEVTGKKIEMTAEGTSADFGFIEINNKKVDALKVWAGTDDKELLNLEGSVDKDGDKSTGSYTLDVTNPDDDKEYSVYIKLKDYEVVDKDNGLVSGQITVGVEGDGDKEEITFKCSVKNKKQTVATSIKKDGKDYLTVEVSYEETEVSDIKVPSSKDTIYKVDNDADMEAYLKDADLEGVTGTLKAAFGDDFASSISGLIDEAAPGTGDDGDVPDDGEYGEDSDNPVSDNKIEVKYDDFDSIEYSIKGEKFTFPCATSVFKQFTELKFDDAKTKSGAINFANGIKDGNTDYDLSIRLRNNTDAEIEAEKCTVERMQLQDDLAKTMQFAVNGVKVGDSVADLESAFNIDCKGKEFITIKDSKADNSIVIVAFDGTVSQIKVDFWSYPSKK